MVRVKFEEDVSRFHIVPGSTGNVAIYSHHMLTAIETSGFLGVRATDEYLQRSNGNRPSSATRAATRAK